jgi:hypothetical protein
MQTLHSPCRLPAADTQGKPSRTLQVLIAALNSLASICNALLPPPMQLSGFVLLPSCAAASSVSTSLLPGAGQDVAAGAKGLATWEDMPKLGTHRLVLWPMHSLAGTTAVPAGNSNTIASQPSTF